MSGPEQPRPQNPPRSMRSRLLRPRAGSGKGFAWAAAFTAATARIAINIRPSLAFGTAELNVRLPPSITSVGNDRCRARGPPPGEWRVSGSRLSAVLDAFATSPSVEDARIPAIGDVARAPGGLPEPFRP